MYLILILITFIIAVVDIMLYLKVYEEHISMSSFAKWFPLSGYILYARHNKIRKHLNKVNNEFPSALEVEKISSKLREENRCKYSALKDKSIKKDTEKLTKAIISKLNKPTSDTYAYIKLCKISDIDNDSKYINIYSEEAENKVISDLESKGYKVLRNTPYLKIFWNK